MLIVFMHQIPPHSYPANLQNSTYKLFFTSRVENTVDPDQMASTEAIWSGSTVFSTSDKSGFNRTRVKIDIAQFYKPIQCHTLTFNGPGPFPCQASKSLIDVSLVSLVAALSITLITFSQYIVISFFSTSSEIYRGSYMSTHVLLNFSNELGERDKMQGLQSILSLFGNKFNEFINTQAPMLDSIYGRNLKLLKIAFLA